MDEYLIIRYKERKVELNDMPYMSRPELSDMKSPSDAMPLRWR